MDNKNSITLDGQLIRNPLVRTATNGRLVCYFTLATEKRLLRKTLDPQQTVSFFDVEVSNQYAEQCAALLEKNSGVQVMGRLREMTWLDDKGNPQSRFWIVGEFVKRKEVKPLDFQLKDSEKN